MGAILTDLGEEWYTKNDLTSVSLDVGLYDDNTDSISDSDDLGAITTEPSDGNYARQTGVAFTASSISGNWGIDNDNDITFDMTNTTGTVDSFFIVANFDAGGGAADHLVITGTLSQSYDLSNVDEDLIINAGTAGATIN